MTNRTDLHQQRLSPRMRDVLILLSQGHTYQEAAAILCLEVRTVRNHAYSAAHRLDAKTVTHAVVIYDRMRLDGALAILKSCNLSLGGTGDTP